MPPLKQEHNNIMTTATAKLTNNHRVTASSSSIKTIQEDNTLSSDSNQNSDAKTTKHRRRGLATGLRRRIKRSRSAPPVFNRKNSRRSLVQQHYKIDKENHALLPGVPVHDDDFARDMHDFFNLIILVPIVVLNVLNWDWDALLYGKSSGAGAVNNHNLHKGHAAAARGAIPFLHAWTDEYFHLFFWTTVAYFTIDLLWVCIVPKCVKSPSTIIQHHIAVFLYLIIPYLYPQFRFLMGVCMSVELNTWFLIARRVFNKQGFSPWQLDIPYLISVRVKLISIFFYITWIGIRCGVYPYVLYVMVYPMSHVDEEGAAYIRYIAIALQTVFCFLNANWSLQLLNSKIKQWKNKEETKIASGL
jgi:hypothetical protein